MWATALVLTGWGIGVMLANKLKVDVSSADGYLMGVGAAALVGGLIARRGFAVDLIGVGATALAAGVLHTFAGDVIPALVEPWPYVALLGVVGAVNVALALALALAPASGDARTSTRAGRGFGPQPTETSPTT